MQVASLPTRFTSLQQEFRQELIAIADWWAAHTVDYEQGGFYGEIDAENQPVKNASKGIILNARILWFFSEVAQEVDNPAYRSCATRAYNYVIAHFFDNEQGGVYWELDAAAVPINTKKQVYAQAFTIYALCAYYQLTRDEQALERALECFKLVEQYAIDHTHQGYRDALTPTLIKIAQVTMDEAIGEQGQVIDSYDFATCKINPDTVWWVQAEALVGFVYAYTTCGEERFYRAAENVWQFIKTYQIDHKQGEWHWLSNLDEPDMDAYYKVGFWKCPYHNGRAMMEAIRYLNKLV